jgi:hypothetical protein
VGGALAPIGVDDVDARFDTLFSRGSFVRGNFQSRMKPQGVEAESCGRGFSPDWVDDVDKRVDRFVTESCWTR